jgi:hypothetical protein
MVAPTRTGFKNVATQPLPARWRVAIGKHDAISVNTVVSNAGAGTDKTKRWIETPAPVVVLVEPQLGENIGATARAMANFGLPRLRSGEAATSMAQRKRRADGGGRRPNS